VTHLRDDGYLETNDLFVAACFLDRTVWFMNGNTRTEDILFTIYPNCFAGLKMCMASTIYIPAATVRDVWFQEPWSRAMLILDSAIKGPEGYFDLEEPSPVADWLDKHAPRGE